jgi:hypothetical protein
VTVDPNDEPEYTARLVLSPRGGAGYTEANLERYPRRLSIAVEYDHTDRRVQPASGPLTGAEFDRWGASIVLKALESLFFYAQYYGQTATSGASVETEQDGYLLQGGWLITPQWEIAARYAAYDPDTDAAIDNDTTRSVSGSRTAPTGTTGRSRETTASSTTTRPPAAPTAGSRSSAFRPS